MTTRTTDNIGAPRGRDREENIPGTETKAAFKTTEFFMTVGAVVAILISAMVIKGGDSGGTDEFIARNAWLYVSIVAAAYMISRGLAKSGVRDPYTDSNDGDSNGRAR